MGNHRIANESSPSDDSAPAEQLCSSLIKMNREIVFNQLVVLVAMQTLEQIETTIGFAAAFTASHDT